MPKIKDPECQDQVKNVKNDTTGVVIAKYPLKRGDGELVWFLDVRAGDERIYYQTLMTNWTVVKACDE